MTDTFEQLKSTIISCHKNTTPREKVHFYDTIAEDYDQYMVAMEYNAPTLAAKSISSHFSGDRAAAVVLDVACGTGLTAKQMLKFGFKHFVGIDGSEGMLQLAKSTEIYQDLQNCMLGEEQLPIQSGTFDVVVIVGALSVGQVPVGVVRDLCKASKPGGYICMTTRKNRDNEEYKKALERELKQMEDEGLWSCVTVNEVDDWERGLTEYEDGYIPGAVYLYRTNNGTKI